LPSRCWPERGLPANPGAWIVTTARNVPSTGFGGRKRLAEKFELLKHEVELEAQLAAVERDRGGRDEPDRRRPASPHLHSAATRRWPMTREWR